MIPTEVIQIKRMLEGNYLKAKEMDDTVFVLTLAEYDYQTMQQAVINYIKVNKYQPTVANLIDEYEEVVKRNSQVVIHEMARCGVFACESEYEKALVWAEKGLFPNWFKDTINKFVLTRNLDAKKVLYLG
jgi:hypothetical protein